MSGASSASGAMSPSSAISTPGATPAPATSSASAITSTPGAIPASVANSPLFKLPPELRNRIYEYAVDGKPRIASHINEERHRLLFTVEYNASEPALLGVCQTIRCEAIGYFLARPAFKVVVIAVECTPILEFWERRLQLMFWKQTMEVDDAVRVDMPPWSLKGWNDMAEWLQNAQQVLLDGGKKGEIVGRLRGRVYRVDRQASRKPWDGLQGTTGIFSGIPKDKN